MVRAIVALGVTVATSLVAAGFRFGDSSHAIGLLTTEGGRARHGFHLKAGYSRYTLVATATVLPPYKGNARVSIDGCEPWDWSVYNSNPIVRLELHHVAEMRGLVFRDLQPRDRLAFWVVLEPDSGPEAAAVPGDKCAVRLTDIETGAQVLSIPVSFEDASEARHGASG